MKKTQDAKRPERKITVMTSGTRARKEINVGGQTREAVNVSPDRSFSYTTY